MGYFDYLHVEMRRHLKHFILVGFIYMTFIRFGLITSLLGGDLELIGIDLYPWILVTGTTLLWKVTRWFMTQHIPEGRKL